jgi:hypothetical protein
MITWCSSLQTGWVLPGATASSGVGYEINVYAQRDKKEDRGKRKQNKEIRVFQK